MLPGRKKRKLEELLPTAEEELFISTNAATPGCKMGLPRGSFNMGQTCFMGAVLQTVIHNPVMKGIFLGSDHHASVCSRPYCVSCAMGDLFADIYGSEKVESYAALDLLLRSWASDQVRLIKTQVHSVRHFRADHTPPSESIRLRAAGCSRVLPVPHPTVARRCLQP